MFEYDVCNQTDKQLFEKCLNKLKNIIGMNFIDVLEDVDGSLIGRFIFDGKTVTLRNDENVDALYIRSETDLENVLFN